MMGSKKSVIRTDSPCLPDVLGLPVTSIPVSTWHCNICSHSDWLGGGAGSMDDKYFKLTGRP